MKFAIGDWVVHPVHGVGTVKTISEQQIIGNHRQQYYEVAMKGSTVWVPADNSGATVLRGVAPKQTIGECRRLLSSDPAPFDSNRHRRQVEIADRMRGGLLPALCRTVRDLRARSWQVPLGATEDLLLRKISKALADEWAASDGVTVGDALLEIEALLRECRLAQAPG